MNLRKIKQPRKSTMLLFALIIFGLGLFIVSYNYLVSKKEKVYSSMNLLLYEDEEPEQIVEESSNDIPEEITNNQENIAPSKEQVKVSYNYIGTIEIKKIKLKRGFLNIDSPYNNVSRNVTVINGSTFPTEKNNNLILAAHSGNCSICYFDKLYKLSIGDEAIINYNNKNYKYKLVNAYNVPKTGEVEIKRDPSKNVLTLITCTHNSDTEQSVYIFELNNK